MKAWILYRKKRSQITHRDSGVRRLLQAAKAQHIELDIYSPDQFDPVVMPGEARTILIDGHPTLLPDAVLPRMGSNTTYHALAVIRQFERLGVYCCNSSAAIEIAKDKLHLHQLLSQHNLPTPKTMLLKFPIDLPLIKRELGFPLIIKNITGMEGYGIYLCESAEKLQDLMEFIRVNTYQSQIILQEFIADSRGRDLRVFVLGGRVIGCMKRYSETSFKANFSRGGKVEAFHLNPEIEWLALETAKLAKLEIAGIDLLFDGKGYKICEANSSPGFRGLELVVGTTIAEQILEYLKTKL
jgi:gamma-F420-2:alpha-L-glutamate ligase